MVSARAVRFCEPYRVEVAAVEVPEPGAGEALVETEWSGISGGTEMLAYRGLLDPDLPRDETLGSLGGTFRYPFEYGYSCAGRVVRGALPTGTPVFAFHPHQDRFVVTESDVVTLPTEANLRTATLFPLVETALQVSLDTAAAGHGLSRQDVVLLGLGPVGLLTALLLRQAGARVLAGEPLAWRRDLATDLGIVAVAPADLPAQLPAGGVPLLVELSGAPGALADALGLLAHEGTAVVGSWYGTAPVPLPLGGAFHRRRLTIRSSQVSTVPAVLSAVWDVARRREEASRLLGALPLAALATTDFAFAEAPAAYAAIDEHRPGLVHAALGYG